MTHGHELKEENVVWRGRAGLRGIKGGKWDNCSSMINKICLKICFCIRLCERERFILSCFLDDKLWNGM